MGTFFDALGGNLINDPRTSGVFDDLILGDAISKNITLSGFHTGNARITGNITGISGNNPVVRKTTVYINSDPGAGHNESFKLSFYKGDGHVEDELIWTDFFSLVYSEVKVQIAASSTNGDIDLTDGFVEGDKIRFLGGTPETQAVTGITDTDTIAFTETGGVHAVNEGVVRVYECADMFQLFDGDSSNEIHVALENIGTVLTGSTDILITLELQ